MQQQQQQPLSQNTVKKFIKQTIYSLNLDQLSQPNLSDHLLQSLNIENPLVADLC